MIEPTFAAWAGAQQAILNLVGNRIYPDRLPQGASFPALTYAKSSHQSVKGFGGLTGLSVDQITVDCWGLMKADAKNLAFAVRGNKTTPAFDGFKGIISGIRIQAAFCQNEIDLFDPPKHGDDVGVYHTNLDFEITWEDF